MRKSTLLIGCAAGSLLAAAALPAAAQSFQGEHSVVTGAANVLTGPTTTNVQVLTPETVINWSVEDFAGLGTIEFQPAGTTATFETIPGIADYTVLNRILPVDGGGLPTNASASINGTVTALLVNAPGGHVWFYSPNGIIAGPTARFNVGSLILTTNDIAFVPNPGGGFGSIYGPGGLVDMNAPADSTGFVEIQPGAQLSASGLGNAYVALVAPRVVQGGLVQADGRIAYLAAEQVDLTINAGLFDFQLTLGTTDAEGIVHTGTTTGPASASAVDLQRISMVALPKNDALTMMLSGAIGYTPADDVANEGSTVVLAAGFATDTPSNLPLVGPGSIEMGTGSYLNDVTAWASSGITVAPTGGTTGFGGNAALGAAQSIQLGAEANEQITVAGELRLAAGVPGVGGTIGLASSTTGSQPGGLISVTGDLTINASSDGILAGTPPDEGLGGSVTILADGGTIRAADLFVDAYGIGQFDAEVGGTGTGGQISASATGGGTISADIVTLYAYGAGGLSDERGGDGIGGGTSLAASDGTLDLGLVLMNAGGQGGSGTIEAGDGIGGRASITLGSGTQDWDELLVNTDATAGFDPELGLGASGNATADPLAIRLDIALSGRLTVRGDATLTANAYAHVNGLPGFAGRAGGIDLAVRDSGSLTVEGTLLAHASALLVEGVDIDPDSSPNQIGGAVRITAEGGSMSLDTLDAAANARTLSGLTAAGDATAGSVLVSVTNGGAISLGNALGTSRLALAANAYGSPGPIPGDATGGLVELVFDDGTLSVAGNADLTADAMIGEFFVPPPNGDGFLATGGTVTIDLDDESGSPSVFVPGNLFASAIGDARSYLAIGTLLPGGDPIQGNGGHGTGGRVSFNVDTGTVSTNTLRLDASGIGGASAARTGPAPFQSGSGSGGLVQLRQAGGFLSLSTLDLVSDGQGGGGATSASGAQRAALAGDGAAGTAVLGLLDGELGAFDITLSATGTGAAGMSNTGTGDATGGGSGVGGTIQMFAPEGWAGSVGTTTLTVEARGVGGVGGLAAGAATTPATGSTGNGGEGTGGSAVIELYDGSFSLGTVVVDATGIGGNSGDAGTGALPGAVGGDGFGGEARLAVLDSPAGPVGARRIGSLLADAGARDGLSSYFSSPGELGELFFEVELIDATAPLDIQGDLSLYNSASALLPSFGIAASISGAPLEVGGNVVMVTDGTLSISAIEPLGAAGFITLSGYSFDSSGLIRSSGSVDVFGAYGIAADRLSSGGSTVLQAFQGPLVVDDLVSADEVIAVGQSVQIASSGALTFADLDATAGDLAVSTAGDLALAAADATGSATLASADAAVRATGAVTVGGNLSVMAGAGIALPAATSGGTTLLSAPGGAVDVAQLVSIGAVTANAESVDITSTGGLLFAEASASAGNVTIQTDDFLTLEAVSASELADLRTDGTLHVVGDITAGAIGLRANADILADAGLLATGALTADARGAFILGGAARGTTVSVASGDITLGSNAQLGARGQTTELTLLNANVAALMIIGGPQGPAAPGTYQLDQTEATRLFADDGITIGLSDFLPEPGYGRIAIRDLALAFGPAGNLGTGGQLEVSTPAEIAITGNVALSTSAADDTFLIDPTLVELDSSTGSIALLGGGGAPLGRLAIVGDMIAIASTGALTQLRTLTSLAAINALLDTPGGNGVPVRAGAVALTANDALYIQNSGTSSAYPDRRGFASGGLDIATASATTRIAINGQILTGGGAASGPDTAPLIRINGAVPATGGQFDPASTINGCVIGASCAVIPPPPPDNGPILPDPPSDTDLVRPRPDEASPPSLFVAPIIELADNDPLVEPPLVDEPITGIGNDDLWEPPCPDGDGGACREADGRP